jgi:hypothetical protein
VRSQNTKARLAVRNLGKDWNGLREKGQGWRDMEEEGFPDAPETPDKMYQALVRVRQPAAWQLHISLKTKYWHALNAVSVIC